MHRCLKSSSSALRRLPSTGAAKRLYLNAFDSESFCGAAGGSDGAWAAAAASSLELLLVDESLLSLSSSASGALLWLLPLPRFSAGSDGGELGVSPTMRREFDVSDDDDEPLCL